MAKNNSKNSQQTMLQINILTPANLPTAVTVSPVSLKIREQFLKEILSLLNAESAKNNTT